MIAHGVDSETGSWPFITLSSFQQRATTAKDLSNFLYVGFNPVVRTWAFLLELLEQTDVCS